METSTVGPRIETSVNPAINASPKSGKPSVDNSGIQEGIKRHLNDSSWSGIIRNWLVGLVVIAWGGQGIYDRNFNQPVDTTSQITKLVEENKRLQNEVQELIRKEVEKLKEEKIKK